MKQELPERSTQGKAADQYGIDQKGRIPAKQPKAKTNSGGQQSGKAVVKSLSQLIRRHNCYQHRTRGRRVVLWTDPPREASWPTHRAWERESGVVSSTKAPRRSRKEAWQYPPSLPAGPRQSIGLHPEIRDLAQIRRSLPRQRRSRTLPTPTFSHVRQGSPRPDGL